MRGMYMHAGVGRAGSLLAVLFVAGVAGSAVNGAIASPPESETKPAAAATAVVGAPADTKPRDLSALLTPIIERNSVPGMVAATIEKGRVVAIGAAGVRASGKPDKVATDDLFHLGSCTKAMTATLCATFVDEGKLKWTSTIGEVFPEWKGAIKPEYEAVTLEQLLHHRAGVIANFVGGAHGAEMFLPTEQQPNARDLVIKDALQAAPTSVPGTAFLYSNVGYTIAGHMCEKVGGKPWEVLIDKRVWKPLGITSAGFGPPKSTPERSQPQAHGPTGRAIGESRLADNAPVIGPAGTVHMSIGDWAKFCALHIAGARGEKTPIVSAESFKRLHALPEGVNERSEGGDYACGWGRPVRTWAGGRVLTHAGSNTMWYCVAWLAPEKNVGFIIAANIAGKGGPAACDQAAGAMVAEWARSHEKAEGDPKPAKDPAPAKE